jgi:pyruvate dehydrogenase kinase 2/3/4
LRNDLLKFSDQEELQYKLDDFYLSRIGIRIMIGQYLSLRNDKNPGPDMIGLISLRCSSHDIAREAIQEASYICTRTHGDAPQVEIKGMDLLPNEHMVSTAYGIATQLN